MNSLSPGRMEKQSDVLLTLNIPGEMEITCEVRQWRRGSPTELRRSPPVTAADS